jgi:hypothetical protein
VKLRLLICFLFFTGFNVFAQTPGFRFGPKFGAGTSRFSMLPGMSAATAGQIGLLASRQVTPWFAIQFAPWTGMVSSNREGVLQDGATRMGTPQMYTFRDKYHVFSVGFPILAKFSVPVGRFHLAAFAGPAVSFNMGGTYSKKYDDKDYNATNGYNGHEMKDLRQSMHSAIVGVGIELETAKGIIGLDAQLNHFLSPMGRIEASNFSADAFTVGISWIRP